ncbi:hypothetical protein CRG98_043127 [Punica granatum]|uniref:Uncharacterized protein n=1 Tax=Punica granatum TaxID=22663 RepID=A0A2I0HXR6_PUNGR|nr:hypothetical protein CRG98_043127 [Punica granatum]
MNSKFASPLIILLLRVSTLLLSTFFFRNSKLACFFGSTSSTRSLLLQTLLYFLFGSVSSPSHFSVRLLRPLFSVGLTEASRVERMSSGLRSQVDPRALGSFDVIHLAMGRTLYPNRKQTDLSDPVHPYPDPTVVSSATE